MNVNVTLDVGFHGSLWISTSVTPRCAVPYSVLVSMHLRPVTCDQAVPARVMRNWVHVSHFLLLNDQVDTLRVLESVEGLVGITNEGQAHLRILLWSRLSGLSTMNSTCVLLRNFVDWEITDIDV